MPRWGKSVSRRRQPTIGHRCVCGCGERIDDTDAEAGRFYIKIGHRRESNNPLWKGHLVTCLRTARNRAQRLYPLEPCMICGSDLSERHHIDGNVNNNARTNIAFLCRRHHMVVDQRAKVGRKAHLAEPLL